MQGIQLSLGVQQPAQASGPWHSIGATLCEAETSRSIPQEHVVESHLDPEGMEQALPCIVNRCEREDPASQLAPSVCASLIVYRSTEQGTPG